MLALVVGSVAHVNPVCPMCGYDLRAIGSDRCPECGEPVPGSALETTSIPWESRRQGAAGSYLKTIWLVLANPGRLAAEATHVVPLDPASARSFYRISLCAAVLPYVTAYALLFNDYNWRYRTSPWPTVQLLLIAAGLTTLWLHRCFGVVRAAFRRIPWPLITMSPRDVIGIRPDATFAAKQADAVALYTSGALALAPCCIGVGLLTAWIRSLFSHDEYLGLHVEIAFELSAVVSIGLVWLCVARAYRCLVRHRYPWWQMMNVLLFLPVACCCLAILYFGIIPEIAALCAGLLSNKFPHYF
jgi:hypothetical protein